MENFETFLNDVCPRHSKIVLAGDFNLPRACWNSHGDPTSSDERSFVGIMDDYFLVQLNEFPTRQNNILDLVIKVFISEILNPTVTDSEILIDHSAIFFELTLTCNSLSRTKRFVFDYEKANFERLRAHLQALDLKVLISEYGDINQDWMDWKNAFRAAVTGFVPVKNAKVLKFLPWMSNTILHLINYSKKKNMLRTRIKRSGSPSDHVKTKFKCLRAKIKHMLRDSLVEYLNRICACHYIITQSGFGHFLILNL